MNAFDEEYIMTVVEKLEREVEDLKLKIDDNDRPDSIDVAASVKEGPGFKVYGNAHRPEEFRQLIDNMRDLVEHAKALRQ